MPDDGPDQPESTVRIVDIINSSSAYVFYGVDNEPRGSMKVYRKTWSIDANDWPPQIDDVIDPKYGTLQSRPR